MGQYAPIFALGVLAVVFCVLSLFASRLLAPRRATKAKVAPYECGIVPGRSAPERFPVRFFLVAMLFIVFDVEIVFLYPWAVAHGSLGWFGLAAILIFSFAVFESFVYLIGKGALEWGPGTRSGGALSQSAERNSETTIHKLGPEVDEPGLIIQPAPLASSSPAHPAAEGASHPASSSQSHPAAEVESVR